MADSIRDETVEEQIGTDERAKVDRWERNGNLKRRPGAPEGNKNALKHGIYADRFLTPDEKKLFDAIVEQLQDDFVFNKSSDFLQVELITMYFVKLGRAQEAGD